MAWTDASASTPKQSEQPVDETVSFDSSPTAEEASGPSVHFSDKSSPEYDHDTGGTVQTVELDINASKPDYGAVEKRGIDVELKCPVDDVVELRKKAHLMVQLSDVDLPVDCTDNVKKRVDEAFLDVSDFYLEYVGLPTSELPESVKPCHVKAIFLHDAWGFNSYPRLEEHLENLDPVANRLGYDSVPHFSTFSRHQNMLLEAGKREKVIEAALRSGYSGLRNNVPLPKKVNIGDD